MGFGHSGYLGTGAFRVMEEAARADSAVAVATGAALWPLMMICNEPHVNRRLCAEFAPRFCGSEKAVFAANAFGKAAGFLQVRELGTIETPVVLTNTLSVGTAVDAVVDDDVHDLAHAHAGHDLVDGAGEDELALLDDADLAVRRQAAEVLFESTDEGASWRAISPDLTRNDPDKLGPSGGPITNQMLANKLNFGVMGDYPLIVNGAKFQETDSLRTLYVAGTGYNLKGSGKLGPCPIDRDLFIVSSCMIAALNLGPIFSTKRQIARSVRS